ncbi:putative salicylaldehyde dehydrogenase [Venustampulla echinocandica]|uniref:Putative salicylaldehyde dehydrogenase n=1 Tax=Venustampulla echinocandica TaxID=2656787 RepID=A0A370TF09_9HELO|nr:putative salicylaldehyde dehydrogenase [Venustampulla echinocandica]RDL33261.1 putative salicylaldehyde dehydrogenase [Venustampulla echinocandica]
MSTTAPSAATANSAEANIPTHPLIINGKPHTTSSSFPVFCPKTGEHLHNFSSASISDTDAAISAAENAYPAWRSLPPNQKRDIFLKAAGIMESRAEEMRKNTVQETGAAEGWAAFDQGLSSEILRDVAGRISSIAGSIPATAQEDVTALVYKEPYGVVLAIAPWNAPHILGVRSIAYPLAAGNTVILKAPEFSPMVSTGIVQALIDAGLPPGALNLIAHQPSDAVAVTKHLISHPSIKKINFTGSTNVGRIIAEFAGRNLKPVLLELGGKAPAIVWEDADVELAANQCAVGAFLHGGQICMSTERVIVHESVVEKFEEAFKNAVGGFAPESSEAPVLVSKLGVEKTQRLLKDAVNKGAIILHGDANQPDNCTTMRPVVVKGMTKEMDLYYTESFGPTVSLMTIKTEEEALALANDTEYGLTAAVFTKDLQRGLRMARGIESGAVHINGMTVHDETALPHGGMKSSGYGRFGSSGLDEWVRTKTVTFRN